MPLKRSSAEAAQNLCTGTKTPAYGPAFVTAVCQLRQPDNTSLGMTYSTQRAEELPFNDLAQFEASLDGLPSQLAAYIQTNADNVAAICALWQVEAANSLETEPVSSGIPALLLSGDYDPVTPPSFAQDTAVYLDHAYTFEFEGQSHGIVASNECGMELVVAFLDQPDAPPRRPLPG